MNPFDDLIPRAPSGASGVFDDLIPARPSGPPLASLFPQPNPVLNDTYQPDVPFDARAMPGVVMPELQPASTVGRPLSNVFLPGDAAPQFTGDQQSVMDAFLPTAPDLPPRPDLPPDESTWAGDLSAGMAQMRNAGRGIAAVPDVWAIARSMEIPNMDRIEAEATTIRAALETLDPASPEAAAAQEQLSRLERAAATRIERMGGMRAGAEESIAGRVPAIMADEAYASEFPMNPAAQRIAEAESFGDGARAFMDDPGGALRTFGLRALPASAPSILSAIAGQAVGGPMGAAAAGGIVGGGTEVGATVAEGLSSGIREAGIDPQDQESVAEFMAQNPELVGALLQRGLARGAIMTGAEAIGGGAVGRMAQAAANSGRAARVGTIAAGVPIQGAAEGGGEAVAGLALDGEVNPGEVMAEFLGGSALGAPQAGGQLAAEGLRARREQQAERSIAELFAALQEAGVPDAQAVAEGSAATGIAPYVPGEARPALLPLRTVDMPAQEAPSDAPAPVVPPEAEAAPVEAPQSRPVQTSIAKFKQRLTQLRERRAQRGLDADRLSQDEAPVRMRGRADGQQALVSPSPDRPGMWRITYLDQEGPSGHTDHATKRDAVADALEQGYQPPPAQVDPFADLIPERNQPNQGRAIRVVEGDQTVTFTSPEGGVLYAITDGPDIFADVTFVPENVRRQGVSVALHDEAIRLAESRGGNFYSGYELSPEGAAFYEGLRTRGYLVDLVEMPSGEMHYRVQIPQQETPIAPEPVQTEPATMDPAAVEERRQQSAALEREAIRENPELRLQQPTVAAVRQIGGIAPTRVDADGNRVPTWAATELAHRGITPGKHPSIFRREGQTDLDNITPDQISPDAAVIFGLDEGGRYLNRQAILDGIVAELTGQGPRYTTVSGQAAYNDLRAAQRDLERGPEERAPSQEATPEPIDSGYVVEFDPMGTDETYRRAVSSEIDRAVREKGLDLTPAERAAVERLAESMQRIDVLDALTDEMMRSVRSGEWQPQRSAEDGEVPGFDVNDGEGADRQAGSRADPASPGGRRGAEGERPADSGQPRRADDFSTEQTPAGEQAVIPGAEARPAGEGTAKAAQTRAQDEAKVRQQQSKMRTGTPQDDPGGLFGGDQKQLLDAPTRVGRRPKGGISPGFMEFSFTNRASVFSHAFRAAGLDPDTAVNLPIEDQLQAVRKAVETTFGISVELPTRSFMSKNRFGRKVVKTKTDITPREAVDQLLNAYRNLQMLAHVMALPETAIGLPVNGKGITLSLVSRGSLRGALGMYSYTAKGDNRTIYLPGMSNSFAHEWAHALDHYMAIQSDQALLKVLLTEIMAEHGVQPHLSPKRHLTDAFAHIIWSMYGDGSRIGALRLQLQVESAQVGADGQQTPAAKRAQKILTDMREGRMPPPELRSDYFKSSEMFGLMNGDTTYFVSPAEMFARAFEALTAKQVEAVSDMPQAFLTKGTWAYQDSDDTRAALTFPKGIDLQQFALAIGNLQQAMARIALHGPNAPATAPASHDTLGTRELLKVDKRQGLIGSEATALVENLNALRNIPAALRSTTATFNEKLGEFHSQVIRTGAATLFSIAARQTTPEARQALTNIAMAVGKQPGKGRPTTSLWEENVRRTNGTRLNKIEGAVNKAVKSLGQRSLNPTDLRNVRGLLTGEYKAVSPALDTLAKDLRQILNDIWYDLKNAGVEVGYASNYLPHIYDADRAQKNTEAFRKAAGNVYRLLFDREVMGNPDPETQMKDVNAIINGLRGATEATAKGERSPSPRLSEADEAVITRFRDARKKLRDLERSQAKSPDPDKFVDKIEAAADALTEAQGDMLDMLRDRWSDYSAERWQIRQGVGELNDFGAIGPTANFLKGRTLPNEAGVMMKEFMSENPIELMMGYSLQAQRRSEYAAIFGADNAKLKNMLEVASKAGATKSDLAMVKQGINAATGRMQASGSGMQNLTTTTFVFGNLSLLPMATFSSIAEPLTSGLRTGMARDSLRAMGVNIAMLVRKKRRGELMELARTIGLILPYAQDSLMQNRLGMDVLSNRSGLQRVAGSFFVLNGLTPLTHYQRAMTLPVANAVLLRLLKADVRGQRGYYGRIRDMIDGTEGAFAHKELNELGILKEHRQEMLDWLESLDGEIPQADDLFGPDGQNMHRAGDLWARATYRFSTETIQDPLKTDRTFMANHPDYSAMYGIMSFIDAFTRNVIWRTLERGINEGDGRIKTGAKMTANAALMIAPLGALIVGQVLVGVVREAIGNMDKIRELDEDDDEDLAEWLIERGLFRSGVFGRLDPLMNMVHGVRYNTDLASMRAGPYLGHFARQAQQIIAAFQGRNAVNTNTAEVNAAAAAYRLLAQPAITAGLSSLSYGRASIWAGRAALMTTARYSAANDFAEWLLGEKGSRHVGDPPWWEMGGGQGDAGTTRFLIRPALDAVRGN